MTINRSDLEKVMRGAASFDDQIAAGKAKLDGKRDVYRQLKSTLIQFEIGLVGGTRRPRTCGRAVLARTRATFWEGISGCDDLDAKN